MVKINLFGIFIFILLPHTIMATEGHGERSNTSSSSTVLECLELPQKYFPKVKRLEIVDNYNTRMRVHRVVYQDGSVKINGSSYMGRKRAEPVFNLENIPARHHTYDFKVNGKTLKLRADGRRHKLPSGWFIDPLLDYEVDYVKMNCNKPKGSNEVTIIESEVDSDRNIVKDQIPLNGKSEKPLNNPISKKVTIEGQ
jgi:hypothetical protein